VIAQATLAVDSDQYTMQYELLRSQVIPAQREMVRPEGQARGIGLAVLLRDGMPGWLKAIQAVEAEPSAAAAGPWRQSANAGAPTWLPGVARDELTTLLASLVLSTCWPINPAREAHRSCR
jgi:hypothetical protein